jgi:MFS family permease
MGAVFIASLAPSLLFMLFGGVAADRLPRRAIMLWSDTGRAVVVAVIAALALLHILQFWHLLTLSLLFGLADCFFQLAYMAVVPQLVDERVLLQPANWVIQFGNVISRVIGPPLGVLFVASWTGVAGAFGLDAFSFLFSAGCLLLLRFPDASAPSQETPGEASGAQRGIFADIREGMRFVARVPWLW